MIELYSSCIDRTIKKQLDLLDLIAAANQLQNAGTIDLESKLYQTWLKHNPNHPHIYSALFNYAISLSKLNELTPAKSAFNQSIQTNPDFIPAYINLGNLHVNLKSFSEAINIWQQAVERLESQDKLKTLDNIHLLYKKLLLQRISQTTEVMRDKRSRGLVDHVKVDSPLSTQTEPKHANINDPPVEMGEQKNRPVMKLDHIMFEVATACHYDCAECAHGEMRKETKKFQLSVDQVIDFIKYSENSNYLFNRLVIHGPGEPFLWKYFDKSLELIHQSKAINSVKVYTNGKGMDRIADKTWDYIDDVELSLYDMEQDVTLKETLTHHMKKIDVKPITAFWSRVGPKDVPIQTPCACICDGPMLLGNIVFLYCGPPVFDAAKLLGKNIWDLHELYVKLGDDYLATMDPSKKGNMDICRYCWGNGHYFGKATTVRFSNSGGGWQ